MTGQTTAPDADRSELTRLADEAAEHGRGRTVAVVRGFDRSSRLRAAELRRKLNSRGLPTVDLTPLELVRRHSDPAAAPLSDGSIGVVLDASQGGSDAPGLAAELGVPLLRR